MTISYDQDLKEIWEAKEKTRKRPEELSKKSLGEIPQLDEPNEEQKQFIENKMKGRMGK